MDQRERYSDPAEAIRMAIQYWQARLWTALPCVVANYPAKSGLGPQLLDAQPCVNGRVLNANGGFTPLLMPLITDCPIMFQGGGNTTLTFPIQPGDECLVVFSSRCIDAWWQNGFQSPVSGTPNPLLDPPDLRMHNLSDGFAFVGVRSLPQSLAAYATLAVLGGGTLVTPANVVVGNGATGSFTTPTGQTVDVQDGIVTNIY